MKANAELRLEGGPLRPDRRRMRHGTVEVVHLEVEVQQYQRFPVIRPHGSHVVGLGLEPGVVPGLLRRSQGGPPGPLVEDRPADQILVDLCVQAGASGALSTAPHQCALVRSAISAVCRAWAPRERPEQTLG